MRIGKLSAHRFESNVPLAPEALVSLRRRFVRRPERRDITPARDGAGRDERAAGWKRGTLLFVGGGQVNAIVRFEIPVNPRHQLLLRRGRTVASPVTLTVAAQPAVFLAGESQGHIYKFVERRQILADARSPVTAGDVLFICMEPPRSPLRRPRLATPQQQTAIPADSVTISGPRRIVTYCK